jgi:hypothetical protein
MLLFKSASTTVSGFIHEPPFVQQLVQGALSGALRLAVCSLAFYWITVLRVEYWLISDRSVRMAQATQLNLEHDPDIHCRQVNASPLISVPERESRPRLTWACYQIDTLTGTVA